MNRIVAVSMLVAVGLTVTAMTVANREEAQSMDEPRIYRVILPVADIDEAARFYGELLGASGERVSPGRHYFKAGEVILAVVDPRADGDDWDARPNQDHVYFAVSDLDAYHDRANELGGLSAEMGAIERRPWGEVSFYMRDPSGNPLCFVDETTLFMGNPGEND